MTLARLTPRDRRALWIGVIVLAGALAYTRGVPALSAWTLERRASAAELHRELADFRRGMAEQKDRKALLAVRAKALQELDRGLLPGEQAASAAASLARLVGTAADSSNVHIRSRQLRIDSTRSDAVYSTVGLRIDATSDIRGLTSFLARLERGPTLLVLRSLSITQPEPAAEMEALRIDLEVAGLMRVNPDAQRGGSKASEAEIAP